jgi:hypothetical protein
MDKITIINRNFSELRKFYVQSHREFVLRNCGGAFCLKVVMFRRFIEKIRVFAEKVFFLVVFVIHLHNTKNNGGNAYGKQLTSIR